MLSELHQRPHLRFAEAEEGFSAAPERLRATRAHYQCSTTSYRFAVPDLVSFSGSHTLGTAGDINISYQGVEGCRKLRLALPLQPNVREKVRKLEVKSGCLTTILTDDFWPFQPALQPARAARCRAPCRSTCAGRRPPAAGGVSGGEAGCWGAAATTAQPGCCRSGELLPGHTAQVGLSSWGRSRGHGLPLAGLDRARPRLRRSPRARVPSLRPAAEGWTHLPLFTLF